MEAHFYLDTAKNKSLASAGHTPKLWDDAPLSQTELAGTVASS